MVYLILYSTRMFIVIALFFARLAPLRRSDSPWQLVDADEDLRGSVPEIAS